MQKLEKNAPHIREFYKTEGVLKGSIVLNAKNTTIFEIGELCLLEQDKDIEQVIKNEYMACIRAITIDYQILVKTDRIDIEQHLEKIKKKQKEYLSIELKHASVKYIEYMRKIWKLKQIYMTKYYLIASNLSLQEEENIKESFKNMETMGIKIQKIEDEHKIIELMYQCINYRR